MADISRIAEGLNYVSLSDMVMLIKNNQNYNYSEGPFRKDGNSVAGYVGDRGMAMEHDPVTGKTATSFYKLVANEWKPIATIFTDTALAKDINQVYDAFLNKSDVFEGNSKKVEGAELVALADKVLVEGVTTRELQDIKEAIFKNIKEQVPRERMEKESFEVMAPLESEAFKEAYNTERSSFRM